MSDYIKRIDALDIVAYNNAHGEITLNRYYKIIDGIYGIPSADVAPVVRCKDCKWWTKQEKSIQGRCALAGIYPTGGWYCGNGERRDDEIDRR